LSNPPQSPIDPRPLGPLLGAAAADRALPRSAYTSDAVLRWELRWFFEAGWVCLGRTDDLPEAGDQRAYRIGGEGILVVRGADGGLRGFYNTCRHRGHELLEPGGHRRLNAIRCPYHAWVYRLDGTLGAAPRFGDAEGFDKAAYPLVPARIGSWRGWLFANAAGDAGPLEGFVADLDPLVGPWVMDGLVPTATRTYEVQANWKTITEHHLADRSVPPAPEDGAGEGRTVGSFPNLLLRRDRDVVLGYRLEPLEPGRTRVECRWLSPGGRNTDRPVPSEEADPWDLANRTAWDACESAHRALAGSGRRPLAWRRDEAVQAFSAIVARGYRDGLATPSSALGRPSSPR
jgi:Rieske 2Fe-2S family protein